MHKPYELFPVQTPEEFERVMKYAFAMPGVLAIDDLEKKSQYHYLAGYLYSDPDGLKVRTIIVEHEYSSIPFMADYIHYYAHCYANYSKNCRRIHFFKGPKSLTGDEFDGMITKNAHEGKWKRYMGYIVVKPLPSGYIGATVLEPYSQRADRLFSAIKPYSINLFGKPLTINTLQYQEQDGIVGSCVSAATAFAFQKTSALFGSSMPSPSEITVMAGSDSHSTGKIYPNTEMTIEQVCRAVSATGLFSELIDAPEYLDDDRWFNACAYAYLKSGIPLLLGVDIQGVKLSHLITLAGYRLGNVNRKKVDGGLQLDMVSDDIIKFYAHDDQLGPFARMTIINDPDRHHHFTTSYRSSKKAAKFLKADPMMLIVPLKTSIKVFFDDILDETTVLHTMLLGLQQKGLPAIEYVWEIFLIKSNDYKADIRKMMADHPDKDIDGRDILFKSLPQYIWVVRAYYKNPGNNFLLFDLVYDAIDVNFKGGPYFSQIFNASYLDTLRTDDIIMQFSVFRNYHKGRPSELFTLLSDETSPLDFLEDVEYKSKPKEAATDRIITREDYINALNSTPALQQKFNEEISTQQKTIEEMEKGAKPADEKELN